MGYAMAPQQWTIAPKASIGLIFNHNNGELVGPAVVMYGVPFQDATISEAVCTIMWGPNTYTAPITNFSAISVTVIAHIGWIE